MQHPKENDLRDSNLFLKAQKVEFGRSFHSKTFISKTFYRVRENLKLDK